MNCPKTTLLLVAGLCCAWICFWLYATHASGGAGFLMHQGDQQDMGLAMERMLGKSEPPSALAVDEDSANDSAGWAGPGVIECAECPACPACEGADCAPCTACPNVVAAQGVGVAQQHPSYMPSSPVGTWVDGEVLMHRDEESGEFVGRRLAIHTYHEGNLLAGYHAIFDAYLISQDLETTKFVQWMSEPWLEAEDPYRRWLIDRYGSLPNIEFRLLDYQKLAKGTCFNDRPEFMERESIQKYGLRDWSNVVRWLILKEYGGIWVDSDSMPLMDFRNIHINNRDQLVAGWAPGGGDWSNKEGGNFNNNFLHVVTPYMRSKIIEVACEFRRAPTGNFTKKGEPIFENQIPLVGEDKHELKVMNKWLFNDGTLKLCNMREDCYLNPIGLGEFDPGWMRVGDMYALCERMRSNMHRYVDGFNDLLKAKAWKYGTEAYLAKSNWKKHVYLIHTRSAHCRTRVKPTALLNFYHEVMFKMMEGEPRKAPSLPLNYFTYDHSEIIQPPFKVDFYQMIVVVFSQARDFESRQVLRGLINNDFWIAKQDDAASWTVKLLFIVPYTTGGGDSHEINGRLIHEHGVHDDLLLVDGMRDKQESEADAKAFVRPEIRRGLLKMLNRYETNMVLLLFYPSVFVNIPALMRVANQLSGGSVYEKEKPYEPFLVTHASEDAASEEDLASRYDGKTAFTRRRGQRFVFLTRSNLPLLLGIPNLTKFEKRVKTKAPPPRNTTGLIPPSEDGDPYGVYMFTEPVKTMYAAAFRVPPQFDKLALPAEEVKLPGKGETENGLVATRFEDIGHVARAFSDIFPEAAGGGMTLNSARASECSKRGEQQAAQGEWKRTANPLPKSVDGTAIWSPTDHNQDFVALVYDVPCKPVMWDLFAVNVASRPIADAE